MRRCGERRGGIGRRYNHGYGGVWVRPLACGGALWRREYPRGLCAKKRVNSCCEHEWKDTHTLLRLSPAHVGATLEFSVAVKDNTTQTACLIGRTGGSHTKDTRAAGVPSCRRPEPQLTPQHEQEAGIGMAPMHQIANFVGAAARAPWTWACTL